MHLNGATLNGRIDPEVNEDFCETLVYDKYRHRKHLSYFYFQDLDGAKTHEQKRKYIEKFTEHNIFYRLIFGLLRGVTHFFVFTILYIPKLLRSALVACLPGVISGRCASVHAEEESKYVQMQVSLLFITIVQNRR